jgi:hypothetical protein
MAGEQVQLETGASPAESVPDFRASVREIIRPLLRASWYAPARWRFIGFVGDHLNDIVDSGGITSAPLHASLVEELTYQFSEPSDISDALDDSDLREIHGKRAWIGAIGRFALFARFHYFDHQVMLRSFQLVFAADKLAEALGRRLVIDAYANLPGRDQEAFEVYEGRISRWQAFRWGMPQAALLGTPTVTAMRQLDRPVTLPWIGDETRPNLTVFAPRASTTLIRHWQERHERAA